MQMAWHLRICLMAYFAPSIAAASEHRGQVTFRGLPVSGATATAVQGGKRATAITDPQGYYLLTDLADKTWTVEVTMFGFEPARQDIAVAPNGPPARWELTMLPLERLQAEIRPSAAPVRVEARGDGKSRTETRKPTGVEEEIAEAELSERAADGFLINGSVNNGAASPFSQAAAFGNHRRGGRSLYNGGIGLTLGNSAFDARPFSLPGQSMSKAAYQRTTGSVSLGGPLQIPGLFTNGPFFFVGYQWSRNNNATTASALVPREAERSGLRAGVVLDPLSGMPFPGGVIPRSRISPQAQALLNLYPLPNFESGAGYNYQVPLLTPTHQDSLQSRLMKTLGARNQVYGTFNFQSTRMDNPNLFGFLDTSAVKGINTTVNWTHRFHSELFLNLGYQFSRLAMRVTPYFENREHISSQAGILGNSRDPMNWGPPTLRFSSGIASLTDAQSAFNRNQTSGVSYSMLWNRRAHNLTFGGDFRRQAFNYLSQQDPRGTFTFTGTATGSDFADFLLGIPAASSIAFGNADKYLRQSVYDAFVTDDWRINHAITLNAGVRWEYGAPITELYQRLVNLDITPGFAAAAPVMASDPTGTLSGQQFPSSLVRPYKRGFAPRAGIAWRPAAGSSLVIRAGYGVYYDTSVYQSLALRMAQQPPLSKAFSIQNSAATPLTLANGFAGESSMLGNTFAIDPNFRPGYAQNWQFSVQRDLPGSLQLTATYLGIKGTHAMRAFLPNTYPAGAANPCPSCPTGFTYLVPGGNSSRQAAQLQLRRRLRRGFTASLQYAYSKSIDNAAALGGQRAGQGTPTGSGGIAIAQNWRDLGAERGLSPFDQRHLLNLQMQYTTGMGRTGGTFLSGWIGGLIEAWTVSSQITASSGLPQTPVLLAPVQGTGVTGILRPDYTGAPVYTEGSGAYLNPAAYSMPQPGQWGNAGRNSITGPSQFLLNASLARIFRVNDRLNLDVRADAVNALNRVNYTNWNVTVNSPQFGLPAAANAMRNVQITLRLRF